MTLTRHVVFMTNIDKNIVSFLCRIIDAHYDASSYANTIIDDDDAFDDAIKIIENAIDRKFDDDERKSYYDRIFCD